MPSTGTIFTPQKGLSSYYCRHCNQCFRSLGNKTKHEELCRAQQLLSKNDIIQPPTNAELYTMIQLQRKEIESLRKELKLVKLGEQNHKHIEIIDWLKENIKPTISFSDFIQRISGTITNIEIVFEYGYLQGTSDLVASFYQELNSSNHLPLYAFTQKDNQLFYYDNERWHIMSIEYWDKVCSMLAKTQLISFDIWKQENISDIHDEKQQLLWLDRMKRLQCITPYACLNVNAKLKKKIYNTIKINFASLKI